jgi:hypothetical protein
MAFLFFSEWMSESYRDHSLYNIEEEDESA